MFTNTFKVLYFALCLQTPSNSYILQCLQTLLKSYILSRLQTISKTYILLCLQILYKPYIYGVMYDCILYVRGRHLATTRFSYRLRNSILDHQRRCGLHNNNVW